jgi:hypothetical protein
VLIYFQVSSPMKEWTTCQTTVLDPLPLSTIKTCKTVSNSQFWINFINNHPKLQTHFRNRITTASRHSYDIVIRWALRKRTIQVQLKFLNLSIRVIIEFLKSRATQPTFPITQEYPSPSRQLSLQTIQSTVVTQEQFKTILSTSNMGLLLLKEAYTIWLVEGIQATCLKRI